MAKRRQTLRKPAAGKSAVKKSAARKGAPQINFLKKNAILKRELTEALAYQAATADILNVISRSPSDLQPVMETIVETARRLCQSEYALILQRADDGVYRIAAHCNASRQLMDWMQDNPVTAGDGSGVGLVVAEKQMVHLHDVLSDPRFTDLRRQKQSKVRTMLGVPLLRDKTVIGVVFLARTVVKPFSDNQVKLVVSFADQAVIAIENARLFDEVQKRTAELSESLEYQMATADVLNVISRSTTNVQPVFDAIAMSAARLFAPCETTLTTVHNGQLHWGATASLGRPVEAIERVRSIYPLPFDVESSPSARAVHERRIIQISDVLAPDTPENTRRAGNAGEFRSVTFVPLLGDGVGIGTIILTHPEAGFKLSSKQLALVQTFADQAVIAIENTRLFDEVQKRTAELSESLEYQMATSDLLGVISRSPNALEPVLQTLAESALRLCNALSATVLLRDGDVVIPRAHVGPLLAPLGERQALHRGWVTGRAVLDAATIHVPDLLETSETEYPFGKHMALKYGHRATLAAPLVREGTAIGAILVRRREPRPFSQKQIALLETFADQAIIAIENTRLFEQVQARTAELSASLDDLRMAQDRLVQTEKLASLGQLTAGIAHEIKNPLNFVNNFSALSAELTDELNDLLKSAALGEKLRKEVDELTALLKDNLEKVVQHGQRADSIVKNMLLHSREGTGEYRASDINALLDESLNLAYHGARAEKPGFNITLQRDFDAEAGAIELFPQEITRAFLNLISNGFYAAIRRKMENGDTGFEPMLRASTKNLGTTVEIRIRDNGTGVPAEVKEKMFNPFFTTKPAGEGTGLGLSMSHDIIVKQHGGSIDVTTAPGQFTEFTIVLPRIGNPPKKQRDQT